MLFLTFLFYLFSTLLLASAIVAISAKNTVHSVMFLILAFLNASGLFVLLGAEFLAMLLIVVYVGAIAVLFLFVVMMLNVDQKQMPRNIGKYLPLASFVGIILFIELFLIIKISSQTFEGVKTVKLFATKTDIHNVNAIGNIIYTDFILPFQLSGAILFVAMIGAIVLTIREETRFVRRQEISRQVLKERSVKLVKVPSGQGLEI